MGLVQVQANLSKDLCCQCLIGVNGPNAMLTASTLVLPAFSFVPQSVIANGPNKRDDIDDGLHSVPSVKLLINERGGEGVLT